MQEISMRDDPISRTVHTLNLRGTKSAMEESKRVVRANKPVTFSSSPHHPSGRPASSSPAARRAPAAGSPRFSPDVTSVIPYSTGSTSEAAAAMQFFQTLEMQRNEAIEKQALLEASLATMTSMFAGHVAAVEASVGPLSQFYTVVFGQGHIGLILTSDDEGAISVAELRDDRESGRPLLAKASGKIFVGDHVLAVNAKLLARYGTPTPEQVAAEFRGAARPMTVLFKRNAEARLRAAIASGSTGL